MGVDVTGWVEVKPSYFDPSALDDVDMGRWVTVIRNVGFLVGRDYDTFGCLFGVRNHANFVPLAAERGIPDDSAEDMRQIWVDHKSRFTGADEPFSPSWILWADLKSANWDEESALADSCLHQYRRDEQGQLVYVTKASWDARFAERVFAGKLTESMQAAILYPGSLAFPEGQEWEIDGVIYRSEKMTRRQAISEEWWMLFGMMEALAGQFGDDGVRLVVWFSW